MNWPSGFSLEIAPVLIALTKVTIVLGICWITVVSLARQSAAQRHRVWLAGIIGALVLPILIVIIPMQYSGPLGGIAAHWVSQISVASQTTPAAPSLSTNTLQAPSHGSFLYLLLLLWAVVFSIFGLRLLGGLRRLAQIAESSSPINDVEWNSLVAELSKHLGVMQPVRVLLSRNPAFIPMTWGVLRPGIVLPSDARQWSEQRRRIVLAHELAHVSRKDWLLQMCAEFTCCVYWFHPLAWIAARKLRQEGERACDDAVLSVSVPASDYARELLELVQTLGTAGNSLATALAVVRPSDLERRFEAMLGASVNRSGLSKKTKLLIALLTLFLLIPLAAFRLPEPAQPSNVPRGWMLAGTAPQNYQTGIDPAVTYQGHACAYLKGKLSTAEVFGTLMQDFRANDYLHKRVRLSAMVKSEGLNDWAGLWMRVDQGSSVLAIDNMYERPIKGTTDWQNYSVVLDVPENASGIFFGVILTRGGTVWLSNVKFETVGADVPTTARPLVPIPNGPNNLDFEN